MLRLLKMIPAVKKLVGHLNLIASEVLDALQRSLRLLMCSNTLNGKSSQ